MFLGWWLGGWGGESFWNALTAIGKNLCKQLIFQVHQYYDLLQIMKTQFKQKPQTDGWWWHYMYPLILYRPHNFVPKGNSMCHSKLRFNLVFCVNFFKPLSLQLALWTSLKGIPWEQPPVSTLEDCHLSSREEEEIADALPSHTSIPSRSSPWYIMNPWGQNTQSNGLLPIR